MKDLDAILIPGGGLTKDGQLPPWTKARLEVAIEHYRDGITLLALSGGTVHKPPPIDGDGYPLFESRIAADYLLKKGVPSRQIITEISSYDTIGNAYYSRFIHTQPAQLQRLLTITSDFHMHRTKAVFQWVYNLPPLPFSFQLFFKSSPNCGLKGEALQARKEREARSLQLLEETKAQIHTLKAFHRWFYTQHKAYTVGKSPDPLSGHVKDSY